MSNRLFRRNAGVCLSPSYFMLCTAHAEMQKYSCLHENTCVQIYTHIHMQMHTWTHTLSLSCTACTHTCKYTHTETHTHTCKYTHTHTHTHTHTFELQKLSPFLSHENQYILFYVLLHSVANRYLHDNALTLLLDYVIRM